MPEPTKHTQPDDQEVLVRVENVSKKFCRNLKKSLWYGVQDVASEVVGRKYKHDLRPDEFWAIKDVSFELRRGECLGLIGHNGAGKTTLLKMLNGLIKPDRGRIEMNGRVGALIALGTGFNPILTGRENIYVNASILGISKKEIDTKIDDIIEFAEIGEFIDTPVQNYSSGMQVRLGFAVAVNMQPDILLIDEVLAVGDVSFKQKAYAAIYKVIKSAAVIFVSHSISQVGKVCTRGLLMKKGTLAISSNAIQDVIDGYFGGFDHSPKCQISGSGQIKLLDLEVMAGTGESVSQAVMCPHSHDRQVTVTYNDSLKFVFRLDVDKSVECFHMGVFFSDMEMKGVAQCISINSGTIFRDNSNGICRVELVIPRIPLARGRYELIVRIDESPKLGSSMGKSLSRYDRLLSIHVLSGSLVLGEYPVHMNGDWKQI